MRIFYVPTYLHYNLLQQHQAASIRQRLIQNRHGKKASYHNKNANVHRKGRLSAAYQCQNNISRFKSLRHSSKELICPIGAYRKATLNISFVLRSHRIKNTRVLFNTRVFSAVQITCTCAFWLLQTSSCALRSASHSALSCEAR